ncbi:MAG: biotin--[acetyl-CoA-carboxylase] ligase [Candidatus Electryonea clarkiae]|nr:biotin--[acetyl-CoA-carboxylase] ligase [Candidatus Electryonea clarkiae]MDP8289250.1 biotin--[acetyl-CoA-carboxylase] ligase [Candidatus Electryonea clarkiae]
MDRIEPSRIEAVLKHRIPRIKVLWTEETKSTNEDLLSLIKRDAHAWTVLIADHQTRGHGRHRRHWASPVGGLYFSVLLSLNIDDPPVTLAPLTVGIALYEAIKSEAKSRGGAVELRLKWPNDVLTEQGKLAGILCESIELNEGEIGVIAGIGVNMKPLDEETRRLILDPTTSLFEEAELDWTRAGLITTFLLRLSDKLEDLSNEPEKIRKAWLEISESVGKQVKVKSPSGIVEGIVRGISDAGGLLVMNSNGIEVEITSSERIDEHHE